MMLAGCRFLDTGCGMEVKKIPSTKTQIPKKFQHPAQAPALRVTKF
jgi:hypothetical protein